MPATRKLNTALLVPVGVALATLAVACGGEPAKSPGSSAAAESTANSKASAPEFNGTYKVTYAEGATSTWTVTPCGEGCVDVAVTPETESGGIPLGPPSAGQAHLKDGTWSIAILKPDGFVCTDGTETAMDAIYTWDSTSLKGSFDATLHGPGCGQPDGSGTGPPESFTLVKVS